MVFFRNDVHQKTNTLVKETAKFVNDLQNIPNATKTAEQVNYNWLSLAKFG